MDKEQENNLISLAPPPEVCGRVTDIISNLQFAKIVLIRRGPVRPNQDAKAVGGALADLFGSIKGNRVMGSVLTWKDLQLLLCSTCESLITALDEAYDCETPRTNDK